MSREDLGLSVAGILPTQGRNFPEQLEHIVDDRHRSLFRLNRVECITCAEGKEKGDKNPKSKIPGKGFGNENSGVLN